ncbi:DUF7003 family protein [Mucilaginibacter aquariorum]|uniref:Uncharacterized protein n=1 Tax=Mucilaginibacter aquariorum TaxID=2967225 RepID=A0ABT1T2Y2_9SPHI|nr:hypothetical protein [Mucilaginibacter aquariorum]MCQ6958982.1 hypothetical protein [Mucilaginibacter aquariorum]
MLTEKQILSNLDDTYKFGDYFQFIQLGHPYSCLIDSRLNVFRGDDDRWAIAAERLGYNERASEIELEIYYYGNCLVNLEEYNNQQTNYYTLRNIDSDSFFKTTDGPDLLPDAKYWLLKSEKVNLSVDVSTYAVNGIKLKEYEPGQIGVEDAARLAVISQGDLFRASDDELNKSLPTGLKKILVLNEWHHKDFLEVNHPVISDEHLKYTYEYNKELNGSVADVDFETFAKLLRQQEQRTANSNKRNRNKKRPGSYETWKQIAKVIITGNTSFYEPTLPANTHWKNWPDSGSL